MVRKDVFFVAETHKIGALLKEMQSRRVHLAVVTDEFGGTAGVITLEDILEEIVGDIQDEHDREEPEVRMLGRRSLRGRCERVAAPPRRSGRHAAQAPATAPPIRSGGLLVETAGRVPAPGERIELGGLVVYGARLGCRRVQRVEIGHVNSATDAAE